MKSSHLYTVEQREQGPHQQLPTGTQLRPWSKPLFQLNEPPFLDLASSPFLRVRSTLDSLQKRGTKDVVYDIRKQSAALKLRFTCTDLGHRRKPFEIKINADFPT
jgi:hypothetical protein